MQRVLSFREHHDAWVAAWMQQAARGLRPHQRLALFDQAFAALWRRAHPTLGDLTLAAVVERTLRQAAGTFPQLSSLQLEVGGISFRQLREGGSASSDPDLAEALRFLLVELLTALGTLTGQALTPLLHQELASTGPTPDGGRSLPERSPGIAGAGGRP